MISKTLRTALLALMVAPLAAGCAEERDPINRVQANALDKSFFVGADITSTADDPEFYTQTTVIDVGYGSGHGFLFNGVAAELARVKFEIAEDLLVARLTYARIDNSDGKGAGPASSDGQIVAAFRIDKHFDIRRSYNPSTGEELNVVEENTGDRPWYQRQYMRVDWSKNLATGGFDFDTLSMVGLFGGVEFTPLAYQVNNPNHPDAPHFDAQHGYFDVTTKVFAKPKEIDLSHLGWGIKSFPACFLPNELFGGSAPTGNCNPVEVSMRHSYMRVVDHDYEPQEMDGFQFEAFGGFLKERLGYARNYGMTDANWHRFVQRYNPYERSHYYENPEEMKGAVECFTPETLQFGDDPHADKDNDGTEDSCRMVTVALAIESGMCAAGEDADACYAKANPVHGGSSCDTFKQRCTLPYRHRKTKPLAWYYVSGSNPEYYPGSEWAAHDHDVALRHAISTAKYAECMRTAAPLHSDLAARRDFCLNGDGGQAKPNLVYFGQMDDHHEAKSLAKEVDDCRHGLSYMGKKGQADFGAINSADRESRCVGLADSLGQTRADGGNFIDAGVIALAKEPEAIVLCHSPVEANDPVACGAADQRLPADVSSWQCTEIMNRMDHPNDDLAAICRQAITARRGDLRYHWVNVITEPQTRSPWGYGPTAADPLTGEVIVGNINVWSHVNEWFSQGVVDRIRYIKGELSTEDLTEAEYVKDWSQAAAAASGAGVAGHMTRHDQLARVAEFTGDSIENVEAAQANTQRSGTQQMNRLVRALELSGVQADATLSSTQAPLYDARRQQIVGTDTEAQLITKAMKEYSGTSKLPVGAQVELSSIFQRVNPIRAKQLRNLFQINMAKRGQCYYEMAAAPMALTGLANIAEQKFAGVCAEPADGGGCNRYFGNFGTAGRECSDPNDPTSCNDVPFDAAQAGHKAFAQQRADRIRRYVAQRAQYAVIVHEMGHTMGERHNFVSSSDAFNYRAQYWQLRTNNGENKTLCSDYAPDGSCVGPRWFDPITKYEKDNLIDMWAHSSVMDYAGEYTQDFLGLAAYDFGAMRMFYGGSVAVYQDPTYNGAQLWFKAFTRFGGLLGFRSLNQSGSDFIHYSELQQEYNLIKDCRPVTLDSYKPASWDEATQGIWHPVLDGLTVPDTNGNPSKCRQQPVDYVPIKAMKEFQPIATLDFLRIANDIDENDRIRVPYGFGTDRWADIGNASVFRHDNGADVYEIFNFLSSQQELQHIFDNYRRGRSTFSVASAAGRTNGRYNTKIRDGGKAMALLKNIAVDMDGLYGEAGNWIATDYPDNVVASTLVFEHFTAMMARPQTGFHYYDPGENVLYSKDDSYGLGGSLIPAVTIPNGGNGVFGSFSRGGKLIENQLSDKNGEFDTDYTLNAGSYYDKVAAPYLLTESEDNFISDSRQDFVDGRYRAISFADLYPEGYRRFLANMLTEDNQVRAPRLAADTNGKVLRDADLFPLYGIGHISWWGDAPKLCFPQEGTTVCEIPDSTGIPSTTVTNTIPLDPEVGFEQQKFLIAQTLLYLPENQQQKWLNMLQLYRLGMDSDPEFFPRIEYRSPNGQKYVARTFGTEVIFGKTVQKGPSARMLEWANELLQAAYETVGVDLDGDGVFDTYDVVRDATTGEPIVKFDPNMGGTVTSGCTAANNSACQCTDNRACIRLGRYETVPAYMWQAMREFHYAHPTKKGIYE